MTSERTAQMGTPATVFSLAERPAPPFAPLCRSVGPAARYTTYLQRNGCPRCHGPIFRIGHRSCLLCGWAGPTYSPTPAQVLEAERALFPVQGHLAGNRPARDQDVIAAAVDLWDRGYSLAAIAERLGLAPGEAENGESPDGR